MSDKEFELPNESGLWAKFDGTDTPLYGEVVRGHFGPKRVCDMKMCQQGRWKKIEIPKFEAEK